jgi:hypothetical protein
LLQALRFFAGDIGFMLLGSQVCCDAIYFFAKFGEQLCAALALSSLMLPMISRSSCSWSNASSNSASISNRLQFCAVNAFVFIIKTS